MQPYTDLEIKENQVIRRFDETVDPIELMWHRDDEDRIVESLDETDWMIQLDNQLPINLSSSVKISRHEWHRLIKGSGNVTLKITKR